MLTGKEGLRIILSKNSDRWHGVQTEVMISTCKKGVTPGLAETVEMTGTATLRSFGGNGHAVRLTLRPLVLGPRHGTLMPQGEVQLSHVATCTTALLTVEFDTEADANVGLPDAATSKYWPEVSPLTMPS